MVVKVVEFRDGRPFTVVVEDERFGGYDFERMSIGLHQNEE